MPQRPPRTPLSGPLQQLNADARTREEIAKRVGSVIKEQGGNKVLVVYVDEEEFRQFKANNPKSARFIFPLTSAEQITKFPRAEYMVLGAFWCHPQWDAIFRKIKEKTSMPGQSHIRINWFPMGSTEATIQSMASESRIIQVPGFERKD